MEPITISITWATGVTIVAGLCTIVGGVIAIVRSAKTKNYDKDIDSLNKRVEKLTLDSQHNKNNITELHVKMENSERITGILSDKLEKLTDLIIENFRS